MTSFSISALCQLAKFIEQNSSPQLVFTLYENLYGLCFNNNPVILQNISFHSIIKLAAGNLTRVEFEEKNIRETKDQHSRMRFGAIVCHIYMSENNLKEMFTIWNLFLSDIKRTDVPLQTYKSGDEYDQDQSTVQGTSHFSQFICPFLEQINAEKYPSRFSDNPEYGKYHDGQITVNACKPALNILDLCCGTGNLGETLRPYAQRLLGLDLSSELLSKCTEKKLYDDLICSDAVEGLRRINDRFDVVTMCGALYHFDEIESLFGSVKSILSEHGLFIFQNFPSWSNIGKLYTSFGVVRTVFSNDYLNEIAKKAGFSDIYVRYVMSYNMPSSFVVMS